MEPHAGCPFLQADNQPSLPDSYRWSCHSYRGEVAEAGALRLRHIVKSDVDCAAPGAAAVAAAAFYGAAVSLTCASNPSSCRNGGGRKWQCGKEFLHQTWEHDKNVSLCDMVFIVLSEAVGKRLAESDGIMLSWHYRTSVLCRKQAASPPKLRFVCSALFIMDNSISVYGVLLRGVRAINPAQGSHVRIWLRPACHMQCLPHGLIGHYLQIKSGWTPGAPWLYRRQRVTLDHRSVS